ncbi:ABC transporter permease [Metasolibacillus sp.]|uniref:ABC transporter permease n=1 Tax=Metasolibacillus sp. TaxID=2703680 RepID=UPI0025CCF638|nr:ABC transporter permease [Metasolibacillus sp.]MCT6924714.1 ABC transporter permease [Metasolibacillus sp.]MCT6940933.1 ABC transporter permease [Metasolibacillus sp.]
MFLAWNEIKKNKLRFLLITGVLMLVAYLVFFLSGLATGLQSLNREAVDKWGGTAILLSQDADKSLYQSAIDRTEFSNLDMERTAFLSQFSTIAQNDETKKNVSIFGIEEDSFLIPEVTEGVLYKGENEVVASDALEELGFKLGDELSISSSDEKLTITGFTKNARFNAAPVLYTTIETLQHVKYGDRAEENKNVRNALITKDEDALSSDAPKAYEWVRMEIFVKNLPGYTEQNMTLTFMIYFLFVISSVIVAIFLYVLTVQKISMFGVMKAQGISNSYLARSVMAQTAILAFIGTVVGLLLTLLTGVFLPAVVPVTFDAMQMIIYGAVLIVVAIAGALFSVWTIVRIDPLKAIGG